MEGGEGKRGVVGRGIGTGGVVGREMRGVVGEMWEEGGQG